MNSSIIAWNLNTFPRATGSCMENDCASHEHLKQPNIDRLIDSETHEATLIQVFYCIKYKFRFKRGKWNMF